MSSLANSLPIPNDEALAHSRKLSDLVHSEIDDAGAWIDFARYMHLALYAAGLGYYSGGAKKFGSDGDFVTAPEISALFAQTLARQAAQVLQLTAGDILELGAGTGRLAADLLLELQELDQLPRQYLILEVSAHLREIQQQTLRQALPLELLRRVQWLDGLPDRFTGLMIGNEVLDALPVSIVKTDAGGKLWELGVTSHDAHFAWSQQPLISGSLFEQAARLDLPPDYVSELCPAAGGLVSSLAAILQRGVIIFIDYGFPRREYYHPQRGRGTLMCHYRHYAHEDPFLYPGLQDITSHVDFTGIAETGVANGLQLLGYVGQAQFLINCGITDLLNTLSPSDAANYLPRVAEAQKLLSPAEMGELFKVMALGKGIKQSLIGFQHGDKSPTL